MRADVPDGEEFRPTSTASRTVVWCPKQCVACLLRFGSRASTFFSRAAAVSELPFVEQPPSAAMAVAKPPRVERIRYPAAFGFVLSSPNWGKNLLLGSVCSFIPVVGPIVFFGYEYEIIEALHRGRRTGYPDFDFNRFMNYLTRGVWPWLIMLIVQMLIQPPIIVFTYAAMFGVIGALLTQTPEGAVAAAVIVPVFVLGVFTFSLLLGVVLTPVILRAGLAQDFVKAFDVRWLKQFLALVWIELLLMNLFVAVASIPVLLIGLATCWIGLFPAAVVVGIASCHLVWQLYELFLTRGGEPIPLKEPRTIVGEPGAGTTT
jgi:hypothetical protein